MNSKTFFGYLFNVEHLFKQSKLIIVIFFLLSEILIKFAFKIIIKVLTENFFFFEITKVYFSLILISPTLLSSVSPLVRFFRFEGELTGLLRTQCQFP